MRKNICIIIPAYNEGQRIGKTLQEYHDFFAGKKQQKEIFDFEILVVLNACKDNTLEIVKESQKKFKKIKYLDFKQGGKGFAITEGFKNALKRNSNLIGFVDADMATSPQAFYDLIKNIRDCDGIIASRYLKGAIVKPKQSVQRIIASRIFNFIIRILLGLTFKDTQCGAKIFKKELVKKIIPNLKLSKWAFDVNLLYVCKKNKFKIKEYPTRWEDKEYSKINLKKAGPQMFSSIVRLRLLYSPFKSLIRLYDKLPEKVKIHH